MKKILLSICLISGLSLVTQHEARAQNSTMDDVHLFQSFFRDAPITDAGYGEALFDFSNFAIFNQMTAGAQGGYGITPEIEVGAGIYYRNLDFDEFGSESGIADIPVFGRYNFLNEETKLSGGAYLTLPVGDEVIGEGQLDFGVFGAVRHPASEEIVLTGTLGIDFRETVIDDREASIYLGAGVIYAATNELSVVGELTIQSDIDYSALSGGVDYVVGDIGRLRANLLLGVDDGAPDYGLGAGFLLNF